MIYYDTDTATCVCARQIDLVEVLGLTLAEVDQIYENGGLPTA